jgi:heat shock protein HslJ
MARKFMKRATWKLSLSVLFAMILFLVLGGKSMEAKVEKLSGNWQLIGWSGVDIVKKSAITIAFKEGRIAGSSGCNRYMTGFSNDEKNIKIKEAIASTMMACPPELMQQEFNYLQALKGVEQFAVNSQGELQLFYRTDKGLGLLTFSRQPSDPAEKSP